MSEEKKPEEKQTYCGQCGDPTKNGAPHCHLCGPRVALGVLGLKPVYKGVRAPG